MPANDVYELSVDMTYGGQNIVNVHHFVQNGVDGTGTWQDALMQVWTDNFKGPLSDLMVGTVTIVQVRMRRLKVGQTQQTTVAVGLAGQIMSNGLPTHCAVLIRQRAFPTGRKGTGGVKITGVPIDNVENGQIDLALATLCQTYANISEEDITDPGSGFDFRAGVLSQVDDVFRAIEKSQVTPRVVTVQSRQIGVGQ